MSLVQKVEQAIWEEKLFRSKDTIIVAVSGGPDSVALLHILHLLSPQWGWKLVVAHVNHQFRGQESDREAEEVSKLAQRLGWTCEVGEINVPQYIREHALNPQAAAREKRYEFLHWVADKYEADVIALAHHADDQAETVLMRILRGTGPSGLIGIPIRRKEKKVELVRPLLRIYKSEIADHLQLYGLPFCSDSSNELRKYFRNQVRLDILPFLMQYNNQLPQSLNRLAETMRGEDDYMESEARSVFQRIVACESSGCFFSRSSFVQLHVALQRRLIKLILTYLSSEMNSVDFTRVEIIRAAALQEHTASLQLDISAEIQCYKEYDRIGLRRKLVLQQDEGFLRDYRYTIDLSATPVELPIPEADMVLYCRLTNRYDAAHGGLDKYEAIFDLDELKLPISIRNRRPGDRMEIVGLNGSKKVKDMFIDDKIGRSQRNRIPLILDDNGQLLWIPGIRRSKHALVSEQSSRILHMQMKRFDQER